VPTSGSLRVLGLDCVADSLAIQARVGYMPQRFGLYEDLTVAENMDLYSDLQGVAHDARPDRYALLLHMTGLAPFTGRRAGALSGGMKQKLGLACALIKSPQLLLLDEPTVGVDPVSRRELWLIVNRLVEDEGVGVVLSTAYLDEAERCNHLVLLHDGKKLAEGPPDTFREKVRGRVFLVTPPEDVKPRWIQARLAGRKGIVDATVRSGRVRVVLAEEDRPDLKTMLFGECGDIHPAEPVFEDAFMALMPRRQEPVGEAASAQKDEHPAGSGTGDVVVRTRGLRKFFGDFEAVKGLTFEVRQGEIFGLLGPNGAGKSTTFRMLCGLLRASDGEVSVAGRDLRHSPSRARARLGYMAQKFSLYGLLSVEANLVFYGRAYGLRGTRLQERLNWACNEFGLDDWRGHAAGSLPGGYRQRLAMAAALLHEPEILFLDEPTSGVDPLARREFWLRIIGFADQGVTVIVTTHFMEESEYCDRMLIMSRGEKLALGTPEQIRGLARTADNPEPSIEDAFVALAEGRGPVGAGETAGDGEP
jgi:ABC-2 type transport system ATP-binding protein